MAPTENAPPTAQHAVREANVCADNILATLRGKPLRPFTFKGLGALASLGHRRGVAQLMGVKLSGLPAWFVWRTVYLMKLPGLDRKVRVGMSWFFDLLFPADLVQLRAGKSGAVNHEHFEPGQAIFEQGDQGDRVYIIIRGKAEVVRMESAVEGRTAHERVICTLGAGEYFGEMALMRSAPRNATVRCLEAMDALSIEKGDFTALVSHLDSVRLGFERRPAEQTTPPATK